MAADYPRSWEADVVLRDGGIAQLRPILPSDADALQRFHMAQSEQSTYFRFFGPRERLSERDLERFTTVDHDRRAALIAVSGDDIIGVARYDRLGSPSEPASSDAEVAFNISDRHQGRGIGSVLLEHLAAAARERGITRFVAEVLPNNFAMLRVFAEAGYEVSEHFEDGVVSVEFSIDPTEKSLAVMEGREHRAEFRSIETILRPRSIAVIGAGRSAGSFGHGILRNIAAGGFTGRLVAVHPTVAEVDGIAAYPSITAVPGTATTPAEDEPPVDVAVIAVPADVVPDVVVECADAGVHGLIVVSAGYLDEGAVGARRQADLVQQVRLHGMRLIGPSSLGVLNTDPQVRLNATLATQLPRPGGLGLFTQSGAIGSALLASIAQRDIGVSSFVSGGRRADVSGNDLLQFWEEDRRTSVIGLYVESIGNPRKFSRIARRVSKNTPIIAVTSGLGAEVEPVAQSSRRIPRRAAIVAELFRQAGIIPAQDVDELADIAQVLSHQPLPGGSRVGIWSNSESLSRILANAVRARGMVLGVEPAAVPLAASVQEYRLGLARLYEGGAVDVVIAAHVPPLTAERPEVLNAIAEESAHHHLTTIACVIGSPAAQLVAAASDDGSEHVVPAYHGPHGAVNALAATVRYSQWRQEDHGEPVELVGVDHARARDLIDSMIEPSGGVTALTQAQTVELLACYGITVWPSVAVTSADEAVAAATDLGWPVALKTADESLRHRIDLGGVRLDIATTDELRHDVDEMLAGQPRYVAHPVDRRLIVQRMAPTGVSCVVRVDEDPELGPALTFGMAGDAIELLDDVGYRIPPLTDRDAAALVRSVRAAPRLFGYRGLAPLDVPALEDVIIRVAQLADDVADVARIELNPIVVGPSSVSVLDAHLELRARERSDDLRRKLSY